MNKAVPFDFYLLRCPVFPNEILYDLNSMEQPNEVIKYVLKFFENQKALDALYVANYEVYNQFINWKSNDDNKKTEKLFETLFKYISRMSSRPTPFGLFSGISVGQITTNNFSIILGNPSVSYIRYDEDFILQLSGKILQDASLKDKTKYFINSTVKIKKNLITYIEYIDQKNERNFQWRRITSNPLIEKIIDYTTNGSIYCTLISYVNSLGVPNDRAITFIDELIKINLLLPEFEPSVTKDDSNSLLFKLASLTTNTKYSGFIQCLKQKIMVPGAFKETSDINKLRIEIKEQWELPSRDIFQVDSKLVSQTNQIDRRIIGQLSSEINEVSILSKSNISDDLKKFITDFQQKYEEREIELLEALDPEIGIGYGAPNDNIEEQCPLLKGFSYKQSDSAELNSSTFLQELLERNSEPKCGAIATINLNVEDLRSLSKYRKTNQFKYPIGFYALGNLLKESSYNLDSDNFKFNMLSTGGVSALPLMTRFSHLDETLAKKLDTIAKQEEKLAVNSNLAEIVFLPNRRAGNILSRPSLYKYEIPIICQGSADQARNIFLSDLFIKVRNNKVVLYSKKLQKEIIPRLSSAHNYNYGMAIYRFLCDLQNQHDYLNIQWDWGKLKSRKYLPRVTYKHLILSRATWNIKKQEFNKDCLHSIPEIIRSLKQMYRLPDHLLLLEGDNELYIDLNNLTGAKILLKELSKKNLVVSEYIYDSFQSAVSGTNGEIYNNEILIPFKGEQRLAEKIIVKSLKEEIIRKFPLGSEWLYFKLYCSERSADAILYEKINRLVSILKDENLISKWFFIRYNDPEHHLRIRFNLKMEEDSAFNKCIQYINQHIQPLIEQHKVSSICFETYNREIERYGGQNIETCEEIFHLHSEIVLELMPFFKALDGESLRWLAALHLSDKLLSAFNPDLIDKIKLTENNRDSFLNEFSRYHNLKYYMDKNFRDNRTLINDFLNGKEPVQISKIFNKYEDLIGVLCSSISIQCEEKRFMHVAVSLIHMLINRIFPMKQREQEMVIYHFLNKYYLSQLKINNNIKL